MHDGTCVSEYEHCKIADYSVHYSLVACSHHMITFNFAVTLAVNFIIGE